jgi:hypothetical protein
MILINVFHFFRDFCRATNEYSLGYADGLIILDESSVKSNSFWQELYFERVDFVLGNSYQINMFFWEFS